MKVFLMFNFQKNYFNIYFVRTIILYSFFVSVSGNNQILRFIRLKSTSKNIQTPNPDLVSDFEFSNGSITLKIRTI